MGNEWESKPRLMLTSSTSQGQHLSQVFQVFYSLLSVLSALSALDVLGAGGMSGALGATHFAMCITFLIDKNHVARLAAKLLPIGRTAAFLFGSLLSHSCHTMHMQLCIQVLPLLPAAVSTGQYIAFQKFGKIWKNLHYGQSHSKSHHNCQFSLSHISLHYGCPL